jgi:SecD/SecF fusion protein
MDKHALWKWLLLIGLVSWSLVLVTPMEEKIKLGLDLQGGISFLLEVQTGDMEGDELEDAQLRALEVIRNRVDLMGTEEPIIYPEPRSNRIVVQIPGLETADREWAISTLESAAYLEFRLVHEDNRRLVERLWSEELAPEGYRIVRVTESARNGQQFTRTYYMRDEVQRIDKDSEREVMDRLRMFQAPPGYDFMLMRREHQGQDVYEPYFVRRRPELTGEYLSNAKVDYQQIGTPLVSLTFNSEGAKRFGQVTSDNAPGGALNPSRDGQRFLAIVLDGVLHSAPFIRTPIYNGQAVIEGSFTQAEARELSVVLRAGSLPAPVRVIEERLVDPTLGKDSVASGTRAIIMGGVLVLVFMLGYYVLAGVVANLALILDLLLLPLGMLIVSGFLGLLTGSGGGGTDLPTLTLPGIAGIVLTIGMAVDANVLIFERIREEQKAGKRLISAIEAGYDKVFSTILDANVTTLITAVILFWQGSGPIRGFAIMLSAGIVVSMFVALVVTRLIFELVAAKTSIKHIKMFSLLGDTNIDFLGKRKIAAALSVLIIISTATIFGMRGEQNFGVDFTGGTSLTLRFDEKLPSDTVRNALLSAGVQDVFAQYQRETVPAEDGTIREYLLLKVPYGHGDNAKDVLETDLSEAGFRIVQEDTVGPQVGRDLRMKGLTAVVFALVGIVIYVSLRFEFAYAMGAIVAIAHDILITVGIFCLLGNQLSLPIIAALLTIVGYSVNDTIVVFDRIREDLGLVRDKTYAQIANLSINQTLSRTVLTSLTTLLTVTMLLIFGGGAIKDFALALFIGILVGTYSSIFIATPIMLMWHKDEKTAGKA